MATPHVRHQLHLHRTKVGRLAVLALAAATLPFAAQAQKRSRSSANRSNDGQVKSITVDNLRGYDSRPLHLGLYVAPLISRYKIERAPMSGSNLPDPSISANSLVSPGLSVGFLADVRFTDYLSLNFSPGVSFITRRIEFTGNGNLPGKVDGNTGLVSEQTQEIGSTHVDLPVLLKLKSERRRNTRVYIVGGVKPNFTIGKRKTDAEVDLLEAQSKDIALEYGVGLDLFYPFFKFSPELRFSHGLTNLHKPGNDVYSQSLQSMKSNTVTLYLNIWSGR
ncbi:probable protein-translocating porin PorT [Hymenobacter gelipurpurascens]|uniref:Probable protein-translocating porin PorT n=1 Tax=Hymenobacter gelipurpurascens TaxID=89968 RepID=A0A212TEV2_9BACT|nr:porin family protein [Hymenobacter gelipurpurascens]SNC64364.1 probable protein-translocating porin PorT [Hymenobacter gelipurpurascens]